MATIKVILKACIPPIVFSLIRKFKKHSVVQEIWSGDYASWDDAKKECTGYDDGVILEKCKNALLKVKNGEAVYERDSVLFDEKQYSWGLLAGLQQAAIENNNKLCVLDFGGSLGSTYYQNKDFLKSLNSLEWCIVEQPHFVDCGKKYFENEQLKFYFTIEECMAKHKPNVLLLSSVLQYLEKPYDWIDKVIGLQIPYIIIDRTSFIEGSGDTITIQKVSESIYNASYPAWFFNEVGFIRKIKKYSLDGAFESFCEGSICLNSKSMAYWKGFLFKREANYL